MEEKDVVVTEEVEEVVTPEVTTEEKPKSKTDLLREISSELGINAFNPEEVKKKFAEYDQWKESQMTEQERKEKEIEDLRNENATLSKTQREYAAKLEAATLGIDPTKMDDALKLANDDPSKLKEVVEKYPMLLQSNDVSIGKQSQQGDTNLSGKTEHERYLESKYKNNPYYKGK